MASSALMHWRLYPPEWDEPLLQLRGCLLQLTSSTNNPAETFSCGVLA
jgi:hypothetical protein